VLSILSFFFGASLGSFVQVVATRLNVAPIVKGRSKCLSCGEALRVSDLIPILSNLFLKGRCRYCNVYFGFSSFFFEVVSGLVFVLLYLCIISVQGSLVASILYGVYYSVLFVVLGVIALYDGRHSYLPKGYLYAFLFLSFLMMGYRAYLDFSWSIFIAPLFVALPFLLTYLLSYFFAKRLWLGFGDVLMFIGVGAFFGVNQGITVFLVSVWLGALYGVLLYGVQKIKHKKVASIPFVPFIVIAFLFVLFTDIDIFSIANLLVW
jgi:prepilin signal peptidase PulO-like enzyme (type II secretory pathway)